MGKPGKRGRFPKMAKAPKDHVHLAFCLNYCGTGYRGLQIQGHGPTHHTVEGVCVQAMKDIDLIAGVDRGRPSGEQHHFARSCRTDRGVHAVRNLLSIFVHKDNFAALGGEAGICDRLNEALPNGVRVAQVTVVAPNFVPRNCCNRRAYRYMIPAYALLPPCDSWESVGQRYPDMRESLNSIMSQQPALRTACAHVSAPVFDLDDTSLGSLPWVTELRASVEKANRVLNAHFVGAHRFHNFSVDPVDFRGQSKVVKPDTDEAARSVYRCEVTSRVFLLPVAPNGGVTLQELNANTALAPVAPADTVDVAAKDSPSKDDATAAATSSHLPFVVFQIEGNSFLFNMIRKIVGTMIAVCRGASEGMVTTALSPEHRVCTPLAPGPYLYLALSSYHGYDATIRSLQPGTPLRTLQDAWGGAVAEEAERFAFDEIAADIVDTDLHRLPPLDDLLRARDKARDVTRPQWRVEDAHLAEMKEYKPLEDGATRRAAACSEMTFFLRKLRVYNWSVKHVPLPENSKAMLELKNKRARVEQERTQPAAPRNNNSNNDVTATEAETVPVQANENSRPSQSNVTDTRVVPPLPPSGGRAETIPDCGEDGWIYVAATDEEAKQMRQAQFLARWKRARPWEFNAEELEDDTGDVGDNDE